MATLGMEAEVARSAMAEGASDFAIDPAGDPGRSSDRTTVRRCCPHVIVCRPFDH